MDVGISYSVTKSFTFGVLKFAVSLRDKTFSAHNEQWPLTIDINRALIDTLFSHVVFFQYRSCGRFEHVDHTDHVGGLNLRVSIKMPSFERKYSPGYLHMISIGKTKSTSEKGLLTERIKIDLHNSINFLLRNSLLIFQL